MGGVKRDAATSRQPLRSHYLLDTPATYCAILYKRVGQNIPVGLDEKDERGIYFKFR